MELGFVILYVNDMDKAKAFYSEVLGLTIVESISSPHFVTFRSQAGSLLSLQDNAMAKFPPKLETQGGSIEVSFAVDDVDSTWKHWKESGVNMVSEPEDLPFGRYFMAKDPDGHYLSVYRFAKQPVIAPQNALQAN